MNEAIDQVVFLNTQHCVQSSNASSLGNFMLSEASVAQMSVEPGRKIEDIRVETHKFQYLYNEGDTYHFMNEKDYTQIQLQKNTLDAPQLMKEGETVTIVINSEDDMPLSVDLPASVILEVTHTEPGVKGNTATNATKPATLESGAIVNVPLFINEGDKIKVETTKGTYQERMKE